MIKGQKIIIILFAILLLTGCEKPKSEPFIITVKNLDEVRVNGKSA